MSHSDDDIPLSVQLNKAKINKLSTPQSSNGGPLAQPKLGNGSNTNGSKLDDSDDDVPLSVRAKNLEPPLKKNGSSIAVKQESDDDDIPLKRKLTPRKNSATKPQVNDDSDSDVPLSTRVTVKKKTTVKRKIQVKSDSEDDQFQTPTKPKTKKATPAKAKATPKAKTTPKAKATTTKTVVKTKVKVKKEENGEVKEEDEEVYKWWEQEVEDGSVKWETLEHQGVMFPPPYEPHGVKMKYDGQAIALSPELEEAVTFFAAIMGLEHAKNPTFQKNFMKDLLKLIKQSKQPCPIKEFKKCDFTPIWEHLERLKEEKKALSKEDKKKIKLEKEAAAEKYTWAYLDGRKEKVGNFVVEPPSLFRGRGDHPKTGCIKRRIQAEDITLNLSKDAPIPAAPAGHKWGGIVNNPSATWLASWKDSITGSIKYVFLSVNSSLKGQSDLKKFETARKLKSYIKDIRKKYTQDLKDDNLQVKQTATAMYLIDRLAIRAGNEKGEDEADTVGCCSLRLEHVTPSPPNKLIFDFLGKDSIRYYNEVEVTAQVYKNMKELRKGKKKSDMIFDKLSTTSLNNHLQKQMTGLTAKVFRTFNASYTFQEELKQTNPDDSVVLKLQAFNRANRQVAVLCNHQKTVSKNFDSQMEKQDDRIRAIKLDIKRVKGTILATDRKLISEYPDLKEPESDLEDDWCREYIIKTTVEAREKAKVKFEVKNEELVSLKEKPQPKATLETQIDNINGKEKTMLSELKTGKYQAAASADKLIARWDRLKDQLIKAKTLKTEKDENKSTALGTSKTNYIDPRIAVSWCKKHDVPVEKVFTKTLLAKFQWAMNVDKKYVF